LVADADTFIAGFSEERLADGRHRIVRHGFGPERQIRRGSAQFRSSGPKSGPWP
jgi:hypothetical protein